MYQRKIDKETEVIGKRESRIFGRSAERDENSLEEICMVAWHDVLDMVG